MEAFFLGPKAVNHCDINCAGMSMHMALIAEKAIIKKET